MPHPLLQHYEDVAVDVYLRLPVALVDKLKKRTQTIASEVNKQMVDEWEAKVAEVDDARKDQFTFSEWLLSADCRKRVTDEGLNPEEILNPRTEGFKVPMKLRLVLEAGYKDYVTAYRTGRQRRIGRPPLPPRPITQRQALSLAVYEIILKHV